MASGPDSFCCCVGTVTAGTFAIARDTLDAGGGRGARSVCLVGGGTFGVVLNEADWCSGSEQSSLWS
jgi:hypothetical protein